MGWRAVVHAWVHYTVSHESLKSRSSWGPPRHWCCSTFFSLLRLESQWTDKAVFSRRFQSKWKSCWFFVCFFTNVCHNSAQVAEWETVASFNQPFISSKRGGTQKPIRVKWAKKVKTVKDQTNKINIFWNTYFLRNWS